MFFFFFTEGPEAPPAYPPIPSPLPTYQDILDRPIEIMRGFYVAAAHDISAYTGLDPRPTVIDYSRMYGPGSQMMMWMFRHFYSSELLHDIQTFGVKLASDTFIDDVERIIFCRQFGYSTALNTVLPADWEDHTIFSQWTTANPGRPATDFANYISTHPPASSVTLDPRLQRRQA